MSCNKSLKNLAFAALITLLAAPLAADWDTGVAAFKTGDLATAEAEFRAMTETQPEWAGGHRMLGQTLFMTGRVESALESLKRAHQLAPADLRSALVLSQTYLRVQNYAEAAGVLADLDPTSLTSVEKIMFHKTRAVALTHADRPGAALNDLHAAIEISPEVAELHRLTGQTAEKAGRLGVARDHYARAVDLDPENVPSRRAWVRLLYTWATTAETEKADPELMAARCSDVAKEAANLVEREASYDHLAVFGQATICAGRDAEAEGILMRAMTADPTAWWPAYTLANVRLRLERWPEAEAAFLSVLENGLPAEKVALVHGRLGFIYEKQLRLDEAAGQYRLAADPSSLERVSTNILARQEEERYRQLEEEAQRIEVEIARLGESDL